MKLLNPSGLWLLLGIPLLILIWLIKPPYTEQKISSSYIWRLSDRFMKRKMPAIRLIRWLLMAVELLLVIGVALAAARPVIVHGDRIDYVAILDSSASMRFAYDENGSRYDEAVERITALADETSQGHRVSVLTAGSQAKWLIQDGETKAEVQDALSAASCEFGSADLPAALTMAQLYADTHPGAQVILYTDQEVMQAEGVQVESLSSDIWNAAITDVQVSHSGDDTEVAVQIIISSRDAALPVGIRVDGELKQAREVFCSDSEVTQAVFTVSGEYSLLSAEVSASDGFSEDNQWLVTVNTPSPCATLLVSDTPLYLQTALQALSRGETRQVSGDAYAGQAAYDLYIFERSTPLELPESADTLLINPEQLPAGLTRLDEVDRPASVAAIGSEQEGLLKDMRLTSLTVARHTRVEADAAWQAVLSCDGDPVFLTKIHPDGSRLSVLLFDLHQSNLPLTTDFLVLLRNVINAAVPPLADRDVAEVGEAVSLQPSSDTEWLRLTLPDGSVSEYAQEIPQAVTPFLPGLYRVQTPQKDAAFFAHIPESETETEFLASAVIVPSQQAENTEEATSPFWPALAGLLLILLLIEWSLYHYERI